MASLGAKIGGALGLSLLASAPWLGMLWYKHHDAAIHAYADGSVCDHRFTIANAYVTSVAQQAALADPQPAEGDGSASDKALYDAAAQDAAGTLQEERTEFDDIIGALLAANQALQAAREKPLFCAPPLNPAQRAALYDAYWSAAKQRIAQDATICRRDYPADILDFYAQAHPCP